MEHAGVLQRVGAPLCIVHAAAQQQPDAPAGKGHCAAERSGSKASTCEEHG